MAIGDRIRRIRKKRRLTQAELAMMSGLSLSAIQGYEQGRYEPKRKSLESIAEVFKIPVDELYDMPSALGTNLAEVGTDTISRQSTIDGLRDYLVGKRCPGDGTLTCRLIENEVINKLPPIQPANCSEFPNNSDVISRQAAIDALREYLIGRNIATDGTLMARLIENQVINKVSPIQPKRGKWIYCEDSTADCVDGYRCDKCGFFVPWDYQHKSIDYIKDYNFCPNCGADMRGEQDG